MAPLHDPPYDPRRAGPRTGRWLLVGLGVVAIAAAAAAVDYFEADRFGTALAPLDGSATGRPEWVLAVDSAAEAAAAGLLERRRLLRDGTVLQEWRSAATGAGTVERELQQGRVVAEQVRGPTGLLTEERWFTPDGELQRHDLWSYSGTALRRVDSFDGGGALLASATYALTAAGRLRHFTHTAAPVEPAPTGAAAGAGPAVHELSLVFRAGDLVELRRADGREELIRRYETPGGRSGDQPSAAPERPARAAAPETRTEISYDAAGRVARMRVYATAAEPRPEQRVQGAPQDALLQDRMFHYNDDGTLRLLEVLGSGAGSAGRETWAYTYDESGRQIAEEYRRRGAVVRISTFPSATERVDRLYRGGVAFLRQVWRAGVKLSEELLPEAAE